MVGMRYNSRKWVHFLPFFTHKEKVSKKFDFYDKIFIIISNLLHQTQDMWKPTIDNTYSIGNNIAQKKQKYNISRAIVEAIKNDPDKNDENSALALQAIEEVGSRACPISSEKIYDSISEMDAYYIPEDLNQILFDEDLYNILNWILCRPQYFWRNPQKPQERIITNDWLRRLNYILDCAARHTMRQMEEAATTHSPEYLKSLSAGRKETWFWNPEQQNNQNAPSNFRYGLWYFKNNFKKRIQISNSPKDQKNKVFFNIKSLDDYLSFARCLLSPTRESKNKYWVPTSTDKSFAIKQKDWLFIKNILAFSDMEKNDAYTWKRTHFPQIIREIFYPLLQIKNTGTELNTEELQNHEFEFSTDFSINAYGKVLKWKFVFCTKSQSSMMDKSRRDIDYSANKNLQDMIRWSIVMDNHEDLIFMMHYVAKYFIQNPEWNLDHSIFDSETRKWENEISGFNPESWQLRNLLTKDKWILNTNIPNWKSDLKKLPAWTRPSAGKKFKDFTNDELNRAATQYLIQASQNDNRKSTNSKKYVDAKYIIPTAMRPNLMPIELKFLVKWNSEKNNQWLQDHRIMRLKQQIKLRSRDEKHVSAHKIKYEMGLLLQDEKLRNQIKEQIKETTRLGEELETPEDVLYRDLIKNLIVVKSEKTKKWMEASEFCDKDVWDNLESNKLEYDLDSI